MIPKLPYLLYEKEGETKQKLEKHLEKVESYSTLYEFSLLLLLIFALIVAFIIVFID
jgi:hypothetical protein